MAHRLLSSVLVAIAALTTILAKPTETMPNPASVPESTASDRKSKPESLGSSCVGGLTDNSRVTASRCSVFSRAKELSVLYNETENGFIGRNYPAFSAELVAGLTSSEQCLLPFLRQMTSYFFLLNKVEDDNIDRRFRKAKTRLGRALRSMEKRLKRACLESGSGNEGGNGASCRSQMDQHPTEINVAGVSFDDNALRNLTFSLFRLESLRGQCEQMVVVVKKRRHSRKARRKTKGRRQRKQRGKKNTKKNDTPAEIDTQDPDSSAGIKDIVSKPTASAPETELSDNPDDLTTRKPARGRQTRKKGRGKGKKRRGRGRKGRRQRGRKNSGRGGKQRRGGKQPRGKKRGGRKQRAKTMRKRGRAGSQRADRSEDVGKSS